MSNEKSRIEAVQPISRAYLSDPLLLRSLLEDLEHHPSARAALLENVVNADKERRTEFVSSATGFVFDPVISARFTHTPDEHDESRAYLIGECVAWGDMSFTARKDVPRNTPITDAEHWMQYAGPSYFPDYETNKPYRANYRVNAGGLTFISTRSVPADAGGGVGNLTYWKLVPDATPEPEEETLEPNNEHTHHVEPTVKTTALKLIVVCTVFTMTMLALSFLVVLQTGFHWEIPIYTLALTAFSLTKIVQYLLGVRKTSGHTHKDSQGYIVRCYHQCKSVLLNPAFWIGMTLGYPFEHALWEQVWPFYVLSDLLHLLHY